MRHLEQFNVILVNLEPTVGREQQGLRPCVVLESNGFTNKGNMVVVAPFTTNLNRVTNIETIVIPTKTNGLKQDSVLLFRQLRSIDFSHIVKKIGHLEEKYHGDILVSLGILFDFMGDFAK